MLLDQLQSVMDICIFVACPTSPPAYKVVKLVVDRPALVTVLLDKDNKVLEVPFEQ